MTDDSILTLLAKSHAYLTRQTAGWPTGLLRRALADPAVQAVGWQLDAAALAGEVEGVKAHCHLYWRLVLSYRHGHPRRSIT